MSEWAKEWMKERDERYKTDNCEGVREILGRCKPCPHITEITCDYIRKNPGRYMISSFSAAAGWPIISVSLEAPGKEKKWLHCKNGSDCDELEINSE